jgi:3-hydroxybutyryl-CoA dehydrogenase
MALTPAARQDGAMSSDGDAAGPIGPVGVIGAGAMGAGIAQVAVLAGHEVHLHDVDPARAETAREAVVARLRERAGRGRLDADAAEDATLRRDADLPECELVVEAVAEDLDAKRAVFGALADHQPPTTVLATNTSSLDVDAIAEAVSDPERVLGLHFFNPAPVMRLVEVVHGQVSSPAYVDFAADLVRRWGKTPVRCRSTPGFIVNRVARPFYGEAQRMVEEGLADPDTVDAALRAAGFPMGPFELTDLIGQDVNLAVGTSVWEQTGHDPRYAPTDLQRRLVADGRLGRKTGRGVFTYAADGTRSDTAATESSAPDGMVGGPARTDPVARTLAMLVNEAEDLVARGDATAADVDTAMRLGTGYPKGPIEWGRELGHDRVREILAELDAAYPGGRYRLSPALGRS